MCAINNPRFFSVTMSSFQLKTTIIAGWLMASPTMFMTSSFAQTPEKPFAMLVTFRVKPERRTEFRQALLTDVANARKESGNVSMDLFQVRDDPNTFLFFERWMTKTALDKHFAQPYTKAVLALSKQALVSPMDIKYLDDLAPLSGLTQMQPTKPKEAVDLVVVFSVKAGKQEQFVRQFQKSVQFSRPEAGCVAFHIHAVDDEPGTFVLLERWQNQAAFDFHLAQSYTKELFASFDETLAVPVAERLQYVVDQAPISITRP